MHALSQSPRQLISHERLIKTLSINQTSKFKTSFSNFKQKQLFK